MADPGPLSSLPHSRCWSFAFGYCLLLIISIYRMFRLRSRHRLVSCTRWMTTELRSRPWKWYSSSLSTPLMVSEMTEFFHVILGRPTLRLTCGYYSKAGKGCCWCHVGEYGLCSPTCVFFWKPPLLGVPIISGAQHLWFCCPPFSSIFGEDSGWQKSGFVMVFVRIQVSQNDCAGSRSYQLLRILHHQPSTISYINICI